jgi:Type IV secretion system pilin
MNPIRNFKSNMHNKTKFISNGVKKILFVSCIILFFGLAPHVFAQGFTALAPIPGLTSPDVTSVVNSTTLANFFNNLYKYLIGLAAVLAVVEIIWGGLEISTKDSVSKQSDGKARIYQAILGLVLVLSPVLVFSIINPAILNLSLNLQPLNTSSATPTSAGTQPATDTTTGCTVTGTSGILQIATCPSAASIQNQTNQCGQNNGQISIVSQNSNKLTNGTITSTSAVLMCTWPNSYVFVDTNDNYFGGMVKTVANTVNNVQPLAITSTDQNNGSSAMQFRNTCSSAGLTTCISKTPLVSWGFNCSPTPKTSLPKSSSGECYTETLSCENYGVVHATISSLCSQSPSWTPFQ